MLFRLFFVLACLVFLSGCDRTLVCDNEIHQALSDRRASNDFHDVAIIYTWKGGMGLHDVAAEIEGSGLSTLTLAESLLDARRRRLWNEDGQPPPKPLVAIAQVPSERFRKLVETVLKGNTLCVDPRPRDVCITDIGRYSIQVNVGTLSRDVWFDGNNYLPNAKAFNA